MLRGADGHIGKDFPPEMNAAQSGERYTFSTFWAKSSTFPQ